MENHRGKLQAKATLETRVRLLAPTEENSGCAALGHNHRAELSKALVHDFGGAFEKRNYSGVCLAEGAGTVYASA